MSRSMFLRLCVRAPRMLIRWASAAARYLPSEEVFKSGRRSETGHDSARALFHATLGFRTRGEAMPTDIQELVRIHDDQPAQVAQALRAYAREGDIAEADRVQF